MDAELEDAINDSMDRHKVSKKNRRLILEWAVKASITAGMFEGVKTGQMDVVGVDEKGAPLFSLTKQGIQYVEERIIKGGKS